MILAAGLSPAWQQILRFERFAAGEVNRAAEARWCASGKVLNVGMALHHLGADGITLSTLGGETGISIRREFESAGIPARWIETRTATRVCTTILDECTGVTTELVKNTAELREAEWQGFQSAFREEATRADVVVISGSLPSNIPKTIWRDLLREMIGVDKPVVLDFRGEELLHALSARPFLIKPNREELAATSDRMLASDGDVLDAMRELNRRGAEWVVITNGPHAVWMTSAEKTFRLQPPQINVVNPIGSGDCLTAGIAWGLQQHMTPVVCVQLGIAAAVENA